MLIVIITVSEEWINTHLSERGCQVFMTDRDFYSD